MCRSGNKGVSSARRRRPVTVLAAALASCVFLAGPPVAAQDDGPDVGVGRFEVQAADVELDAGVYYLTARIDYRLSAEAREALLSGFPLTVRLEVEILTWRRYWTDTEAASLTQLYDLEYHALTERYIVRNRNSSDQSSFVSLYAALNFLGRIEHLPLIDAAVLDRGRRYDIRIRALLDKEQLPGPLRLIAFWRRDWSLGSDWHRWQLQGE